MKKNEVRQDNIIKKNKNVKEILEQYYLTAEDLTIIMPELHIQKAREYINDIRTEMENNNIFVPKSRPYMALTKLVKKKFGL